MARLPITCTACRQPLDGGTDTFGDVDLPMCWDCYSGLQGGDEFAYYGLAPHHHDLTVTGHMIGCTVFDPLPTPTPAGEYIVDDMIFVPGPDPGMGFWYHRPLPGWR